LNNNKLINPKLICAFCWFVLSSIMKMHGPKNKIRTSIKLALLTKSKILQKSLQIIC